MKQLSKMQSIDTDKKLETSPPSSLLTDFPPSKMLTLLLFSKMGSSKK